MNPTPNSFVKVEGNKVHYRANNLADAKTVLKTLRLMKRQLGVLRREVVARKKKTLIDSKRTSLSNDIAQLEKQKSKYDDMIRVFDIEIVELQTKILVKFTRSG